MMRRFPAFTLLLVLTATACGYHKPPITALPEAQNEDHKTLFIAFDGIAYDMMRELKEEGHFKDFQAPIPLIVPFPSATTIAFTGIFQPLDVGTVPGYETRFYSFKENRIMGGTPWDIYKIHIHYKTYFDNFRHTMTSKSVMYTFPGVAGKQDLMNAEKLVMRSDKKILFTYLGGTDGAQHLLGRRRTKNFMAYVDRFLTRMKKRYERAHNEPLEIVLFSDHGFHFDKLKMISAEDISKSFAKSGFKSAASLKTADDVLIVKYGLLSSGVLMTKTPRLEELADRVRRVKGMDLVFWDEGNRIYAMDTEGKTAYFEYRGRREYRYVTLTGDPLNYRPLAGRWRTAASWHDLTWDFEYPEAGYRLYDAFHRLVENKASMIFSLKPDYQFGALSTLGGTKLRLGGHKGTHGGMFKSVSQGIVMTDSKTRQLPPAVRYDELFKIFLPRVTKAYEHKHGKKEVQVLLPTADSHAH